MIPTDQELFQFGGPQAQRTQLQPYSPFSQMLFGPGGPQQMQMQQAAQTGAVSMPAALNPQAMGTETNGMMGPTQGGQPMPQPQPTPQPQPQPMAQPQPMQQSAMGRQQAMARALRMAGRNQVPIGDFVGGARSVDGMLDNWSRAFQQRMGRAPTAQEMQMARRNAIRQAPDGTPVSTTPAPVSAEQRAAQRAQLESRLSRPSRPSNSAMADAIRRSGGSVNVQGI